MLKLTDFTKTYKGGKLAVDKLSLHIMPGDLFGFIGHNGAGKTTTLRAIAGILDFDGGSIEIDGCSIAADPVGCKKKIAFIPDNPDVYEYMTGIQYINFIADIFNVDSSLREQRIKKYADAFELTDALGNLAGSYSHGMKQKLVVISALIHQPKLMILDEPFVGLDPKAAHTLKCIMKELCDEGGAIFFSTHVLDVAEKLCNKIAIIRDGKLLVSGGMDEVKGDKTLEEEFMELIAE